MWSFDLAAAVVRSAPVQGPRSNVARIASVGALALAIFGLWLALGSGTATGIGFFYTVPVGLATWWWGRRAGAAAVLACLGLFALGAAIDPVPHFAAALVLRAVAMVGVAVLAALAHERLTVLEHSAEELEAIRAALTPSSLPDLHGVDAAAAFVPSELGVSGDFYLLTNGPDGSTVAIVGDVTGHGPAAARLATFVRARFAAFAASTADPAELLMLANGALADRPGHPDELVSAACLRFRPDRSHVSWALAGHPPPLHLPGLAELEGVGETLLLGAVPDLSFVNGDTDLARDEGVLIYTDGATDVRRGRDRLGLDGLLGLLGPLAKLPAAELASRAERAVLDWADGPIRDDLCMLVLKPE